MFLLCLKYEDAKSIGNNTHIWMENMRKRMYLQFFEDGAGAVHNGQGGNNVGNGNGNQGNAGETGNQATFSYAQAEEIAQARAERLALKSYFQQKGMSEDQVTQAIADYKAQQKKNQPNVTQMQQELEIVSPIPICNACTKSDFDNNMDLTLCKAYEKIPKKYLKAKKYDCPYFDSRNNGWYQMLKDKVEEAQNK